MGTKEAGEDNPLGKPGFKYGIPLFNAAIVVAVAFLFFEGVVRTALLVVAVVIVFVVPEVFETAAEEEDPTVGDVFR